MNSRGRTRIVIATVAGAMILVAAALVAGARSGIVGGAPAVLVYLAQEARVRVAGEDARSRAAVESLREAFNRESSSTRLVAILSPT